MSTTSAGEALGLADPSPLREAVPIGGVWVEAADEGVAVTNPATGAVIGHVPRLGQADTARAIEAARVAQPGWAAPLTGERSRILRKLFDLMKYVALGGVEERAA